MTRLDPHSQRSVLSAIGSVAFAFELVTSYVRHLASGDQAGAALGMYFFSTFVLPFAGLIMFWAVAGGPRKATEADAGGRGLAGYRSLAFLGNAFAKVGGILVQVAGVLMLAFAASAMASQIVSRHEPASARFAFEVALGYGMLPVTFGLLFWVSGARLRSSTRSNDGTLNRFTPAWRDPLLWTAAACVTSALVYLVLAVAGMPPPDDESRAALWVQMTVFHSPTIVMIALMAVTVLVCAQRARTERGIV